ncbi:MAG: helix-turn-helix domain-containing protein [Actinobacteria bacterium]|nr:helix-turn-helix domain-containing protein [Actinomycetota bacterium]
MTGHPVSDRANGLRPASKVVGPRTRDRVRQAISEDGPLTATALAYRLGLTPAAVRRHLNLLVEKCAIKEHEPTSAASRGRGRPARAYIPLSTGPVLSPSDSQGPPARGHLAPAGALIDTLPDTD